jgi:drug/metabolite transporter (DMT)-like permease
VITTPFIAQYLPGLSSKITRKTWLCVALSIIGIYCISNPNGKSSMLGVGEFYMMGSMLLSSCIIIAADLGAKRADCFDLTLIDFTVSTVLSVISSLYVEREMWYWPVTALQEGISIIALVAIVEILGHVISMIGQAYSTSSRAAFIYSLESAITTFLAYLFLHESLTTIEMFGCFIVLIATYVFLSEEISEQILHDDIDGTLLEDTTSYLIPSEVISEQKLQEDIEGRL